MTSLIHTDDVVCTERAGPPADEPGVHTAAVELVSTGEHPQLLAGPVLVQADGAALGLLQTRLVAGRRLRGVGRQTAGPPGPPRVAPAPAPAREPPRRDVVQDRLGQP